MKRAGLGTIAVLAALAMPASAGAASPYIASPGGAGVACSNASPCDIYTAVSMATMAGDQVQLKGGSYSLQIGGPLPIVTGLTMLPQVAGTRPELTSTNGNNVVITSATPPTIQDIGIDISGIGAGGALDFQTAGTGQRLEIVAAGASPLGVRLKNGALLSDSSVWTQSASATAVLTGGTGGPPSATVRNVTAIATGAASNGLGSLSTDGAPQVVAVHNSILRGATFDINVSGAAPMDITVNVDHSNFVTNSPTGPNAIINSGAGNQSATPLFVNAAAGDFTQLAGSATIDMGAAAGGLGDFDLDLGPRVLGLAPDIGADEFPSAGPPQFANATAATTSTKSKCKKGFKLKTVKNKKGKKKKKCVKKKKSKKKK